VRLAKDINPVAKQTGFKTLGYLSKSTSVSTVRLAKDINPVAKQAEYNQ